MANRYEQKMQVFTDLVMGLANLSTCKRLKVGCIVVPRDFSRVLAIGYNGPPSHFPNDSCTNEEGQCGCVHAEANVLIKLGQCEDAILLTSRMPCEHCAGLIINSKKVTQVFYLGEYRSLKGQLALEKGHIELIRLDDDREQKCPTSRCIGCGAELTKENVSRHQPKIRCECCFKRFATGVTKVLENEASSAREEAGERDDAKPTDSRTVQPEDVA